MERTSHSVISSFLGKWGDGWGWSVQETCLGFKVSTDLLTQPQKVRSCGHSWGCWWGHPLGKGQRVPEGVPPSPHSLLPSTSPLGLSKADPHFPPPPSPLRLEVQGLGDCFSRMFYLQPHHGSIPSSIPPHHLLLSPPNCKHQEAPTAT